MATVLVIEDEDDIGEFYRRALESEGHRVVRCCDDSLSSLLEAMSQAVPEVVILDERLGEGSGISFLPEIRSFFPMVKIILASGDRSALSQAERFKISAVKRKPFALDDLLRTIDEVLRT